MKGIDVIEAFQNIDDDMILHARQHRKVMPIWLRWASVAAVLLCTVILIAAMLAKLLGGPTGTNPDPNQPDMLSPVEDSDEPISEATDEPTTVPSNTPTPTPTPVPTPTPTPVPTPTPTPGYTVSEDPAEPTAIPTSPPTPTPTPESSGSDDILSDDTLVSVAGVTFGMNDTDVLALLGEPDSSDEYDTEGGKCRELVYFGTISYFFSECETCGEYHLETISELSGGNRLLPYGITLDDSLSDVLAILGAEDFDTTISQQIYTLDDSHYATFEVLYDNPMLHFITVRIGDIMWSMAFGRQDQLYINNLFIPPEYGLHSVHSRLAANG